MAAPHCAYGDESFVVADYLAGRLPEAEASAFEEHAFTCDRCFGELERATELRAAADGTVAPPAGSQRSQAYGWPLLALAATVLLGVGLWIARPSTDVESPPTVYRDGNAGSAAVDLNVEWHGDRVAVAWEPVDRADLYEVQVFDAAGDPVFTERTAATSLQVSMADRQDGAATGPLYVQVIALDELRQTIARSGLQPL